MEVNGGRKLLITFLGARDFGGDVRVGGKGCQMSDARCRIPDTGYGTRDAKYVI